MILKKIKQIVALDGYGIFQALLKNHPSITWMDNSMAKSLDLDFIAGHSGEKYASREFLIYLNRDGATVDTALDAISNHLYIIFGDTWERINKTLKQDYNPLENYDSTEVENVASKVTNSIKSGSKTYGFNSINPVPTNEGDTSSITEGKAPDNERTLKRHGNIGVTTSAQMLTGEIDVRNKYQFYNLIMNDIDKIMCLKAY